MFLQPRNNIQVSSRPSSPIRNSGRLEPLSPSSSYRSDYPYDNYVGAGIYSPRVYRINLNEKKGRRRKFYWINPAFKFSNLVIIIFVINLFKQ